MAHTGFVAGGGALLARDSDVRVQGHSTWAGFHGHGSQCHDVHKTTHTHGESPRGLAVSALCFHRAEGTEPDLILSVCSMQDFPNEAREQLSTSASQIM